MPIAPNTNNTEYREARLRRLEIIQDLQRQTLVRFGSEGYNLFLFGSYLTNRFIDKKSDVDLAVYTKDKWNYVLIKDFLCDFFKEHGTEADVFYIDTEVIAPVYYAPLKSKARFTDFYPEELERFREECKKVYDKCEKIAVD